MITYTEFISICISKKLKIQYRELVDAIRKTYSLFAYDGYKCYKCIIDEVADVSEFETIYKATSNQPIDPRDESTGAGLVTLNNTSISTRLNYPVESLTSWVKVRPRKIAGDLYVNFVYFTTTSTGSFDAGNDSHFSMSLSSDHTKTYIDFCPDYTYEAGGGGAIILSSISTGECKVAFIGAPDYPPEYGGSVEFVRNKKLSLVRNECILNDIDPKLMRYSASTPGSNKLRLQVEHAANAKISFEYYLVMSGSI